MKHLFLIALSFVLLNLVTNAKAQTPKVEDKGTSMKLEGSCSGTMADGTAVSLNYYSDFDGCKDVSKAAVTFTSGIEGLFTGKRTFTDSKDNYSFPEQRLSFANSTGNTSGTLKATNAQGESETVNLQCDVRDYEYADC